MPISLLLAALMSFILLASSTTLLLILFDDKLKVEYFVEGWMSRSVMIICNENSIQHYQSAFQRMIKFATLLLTYLANQFDYQGFTACAKTKIQHPSPKYFFFGISIIFVNIYRLANIFWLVPFFADFAAFCDFYSTWKRPTEIWLLSLLGQPCTCASIV